MYKFTAIVTLGELITLTKEADRMNWDVRIDDTWNGEGDRVAVFEKLETNK